MPGVNSFWINEFHVNDSSSASSSTPATFYSSFGRLAAQVIGAGTKFCRPRFVRVLEATSFFENDTFTLPENLGFSEEDVILVFNQYEIGSYAEGPIELRVKKSDVASFFKVNIM